MKSRAQTRTEDFIRKLEQVKLSPLEVLQRSIAMAEQKEDYKHMTEAALSVLPYMAPKLQATEVVSESTSVSKNVDMTLDELEAELAKLEEMERLAGMRAETETDEEAERRAQDANPSAQD